MINNIKITNEKDTGTFNQFVAPIATDELSPKKDTVKIFLIVILIIVILVSVFAFFYLDVLTKEVEEKESVLKSYDSNPTLVQFEGHLPDMRILSQRLKLLNSVYDSRIYVSQMMFPILESVVESSRNSYVYFNKFSLKKEINSNISSLSISGMALDYPTLYRQLNNFRSGLYTEFIKDFKLTSFSLNEKGTVEFDITFDIDISTTAFLKYLNIINPNNFQTQDDNIVNSGPLFNSAPATSISTTTSTTINSENENSLFPSRSNLNTENSSSANIENDTEQGN